MWVYQGLTSSWAGLAHGGGGGGWGVNDRRERPEGAAISYRFGGGEEQRLWYLGVGKVKAVVAGTVQGCNLVARKAKRTFLKKPSASPSPPKLHQEVSPTSKPSAFAVWVGQPGGLRVRRLQSTSPCLELSQRARS